jgi:hypothetical protein
MLLSQYDDVPSILPDLERRVLMPGEGTSFAAAMGLGYFSGSKRVTCYIPSVAELCEVTPQLSSSASTRCIGAGHRSEYTRLAQPVQG